MAACSATRQPVPVHSSAVAQPDTTITVNAAKDLGAFNNPSRYQNQSGPTTPLSPHDLRMVNDLHVDVVRVWALPRGYYNSTTGAYNFDFRSSDGTTMYEYLDQAASYGRRLLMNLGECSPQIFSLVDPTTCRAVLQAGLVAYKMRYPSLEYIELFNEPDKTWAVAPGRWQGLSIDDYYDWYKIGYSIVNEVNAELRPSIPLRIGGPAAATFDRPFLQGFLDRYAADPDPTKRLDFISYHQYMHRSDPPAVRSEKPVLHQWLADRHLDPDTPVFVTEYGVFPGGSSGTTFGADLLTQAAGMAALGYYYVVSGMDMEMNWVFNHTDNERKSMFVAGGDGSVYPYFNLVKMESMLRKRRIQAWSDGLSTTGIGVNALATRDSTGIAVLVTNYQWTDGQARHLVTLDVDNLPSGFQGRRLRVERYLVDATTSNYEYDPASSSLTRVVQYTVTADNHVKSVFPLGPNAMSLVVITPQR
jgi:hypothetical protein